MSKDDDVGNILTAPAEIVGGRGYKGITSIPIVDVGGIASVID